MRWRFRSSHVESVSRFPREVSDAKQWVFMLHPSGVEVAAAIDKAIEAAMVNGWYFKKTSCAIAPIVVALISNIVTPAPQLCKAHKVHNEIGNTTCAHMVKHATVSVGQRNIDVEQMFWETTRMYN